MRRLGFWSTRRFHDSKFFREIVESFISKTCAFCWTKNRNRLMLAISNYSKICQIRRGINKIDSTNPVKILQSPEGSHYWQIFSLSTFWQNICWHKIVIKLSLWSNFRFLRIKKVVRQLSSSVIWRPPPLTLPPYSRSQIWAWLSLIPYSRIMYPTIFIFSSFLAHNIIKRLFFFIMNYYDEKWDTI